MSAIIQKLQARSANKPDQEDSTTTLDQELDEETKFVIEQAIKLHRGA
jgi:oxaloacetate decarboxylase gamma subunit